MPPKLGERESVGRTLCTHHLQVREKWGVGSFIDIWIVSPQEICTLDQFVAAKLKAKLLLSNYSQPYDEMVAKQL